MCKCLPGKLRVSQAACHGLRCGRQMQFFGPGRGNKQRFLEIRFTLRPVAKMENKHVPYRSSTIKHNARGMGVIWRGPAAADYKTCRGRGFMSMEGCCEIISTAKGGLEGKKGDIKGGGRKPLQIEDCSLLVISKKHLDPSDTSTRQEKRIY